MNPIANESLMMNWAYKKILEKVPTKGKKAQQFAFEVASAFIGQGHQFARRFEKLNYHLPIEGPLLKTAEDYADQTKSKLEQLRETTLVKITDTQLEKIKNLFPILAKGGIKEARNKFLWPGKEEIAGVTKEILFLDSQNLAISSFSHYLFIINTIKQVANNYFTLSESVGNDEAKINIIGLDFIKELEETHIGKKLNRKGFSAIILKEKVNFRRALTEGKEFVDFQKSVKKEIRYLQTVTTGSNLLDIVTEFKRLKKSYIKEDKIFNFVHLKTLYKDFSSPIKAEIMRAKVQEKSNVRNIAFDDLTSFSRREIQKIQDQFVCDLASIIDNFYIDKEQNKEVKKAAIIFYREEDLRLRKEMVESYQFKNYCTQFEEKIKSHEEKTPLLIKRLIQYFKSLKNQFKDSLEICSTNHLVHLFNIEQRNIIDDYDKKHSRFYELLESLIRGLMLKSQSLVNESNEMKNKVIADFIIFKDQLVAKMNLTTEEIEDYNFERLVEISIRATKDLLKI